PPPLHSLLPCSTRHTVLSRDRSSDVSSPGLVGSPAQLSRFAMSTPPHRRTQPAAAVSCPDSPPHTSARLAPALHHPHSCPDWPSDRQRVVDGTSRHPG